MKEVQVHPGVSRTFSSLIKDLKNWDQNDLSFEDIMKNLTVSFTKFCPSKTVEAAKP